MTDTSTDHVWHGRATLSADDATAEEATRNKVLVLPVDSNLTVTDVHCDRCGGTYADAAGQPCPGTRSQ